MVERLPPLNALRAFESAGRHLSFTKAADELNVTQAAISHQIKSLEDHLGTKLFRRLTRRLLLTDAGQILLPGLRDGFARLSHAVDRVRTSSEEGVLTVSLLMTFGIRWLMPRLPRFQAAYPAIDVRLSTSARLVDFAREDVDVAIRYGFRPWPGLADHRLFEDRVSPVLSPRLLKDSPALRDPRDLARFTFLREVRGNDAWDLWFEAAGAPEIKPDRGPEFDSTLLAGHAAMEGLGVALVPPSFFADEIATGRLIQPFPLAVSNGKAHYLVYSEARQGQPKIEAFRLWLEEEVERSIES
jgi:DNA-binding transcriptional LysR family regulator